MIVFLYGLVHVGMPLSSLNDISLGDIYGSSIDVIVAIRKPLHLLPHRQDYNSRWNQESLNDCPGGVLWLIFAGYVPLASQSPFPIIVYSMANYRPQLGHFWANM